MVTTAQAERAVSEGVLVALSMHGFIRGNEFMLLNRRPHGIAWQLRFGARADRTSSRCLVNVLAGIRFESVEAFRDRSLAGDEVPSIAVPIHFLRPDRRLFEWDAGAEETVSFIARDIETYALPFFRHFEDLRNLLAALRSEDPKDWLSVARNERPELLAAIMAALGMMSEARGVLERGIEELLSKPRGHRLRLEKMLEAIARGPDSAI